MHFSHLEGTSAFFQSAFRTEWKEGKERTVFLPEDDSGIVNTYLHFIYTGKIACKSEQSETGRPACGAIQGVRIRRA